MERTTLASLARLIASLVAAVYILFYPAGAQAQPANQDVGQFLSNPQSILTGNPQGGPKLVTTVRDLVLADIKTLAMIINLAKDLNATLKGLQTQLAAASDSQKAAIQVQINGIEGQLSAIGSGLGQAALANNKELAGQIQTALAESGLQDVILAYQAITGDVVTASTGLGGGGGGIGGALGGGAPGGGGGGGSGGSTSTGGNGGASGGGLTGGGGGGGGGSGTSTTGQSTSPQ